MYFQFILNVELFGYLFCSLGSSPLHQVLYQDIFLNKVRSVPKRNFDAYDFSPPLYYYDEALCATISSFQGANCWRLAMGWSARMKGNELMTLIVASAQRGLAMSYQGPRGGEQGA